MHMALGIMVSASLAVFPVVPIFPNLVEQLGGGFGA